MDTFYKIDYSKALANPKQIFKGDSYRITVLSNTLIRLEYNISGIFEDRPTEFAINRKFPDFEFTSQENEEYLVISTKYFKLQYMKNKPFVGNMFSPDTNLRVELIDTDRIWYYGHDEARNFGAYDDSLDTRLPDGIKENKTNYILKGLYSTDGFAAIDDSKSLIIDQSGYLIKDDRPKIDVYLFMYKRDFGQCLKDYFILTGYPPLIPRYALGIWWNKTKEYSFDDIKVLIKDFNKYKIPLSAILLGDNWHIKDENNKDRFKSGFTFSKELFPNPLDLTKYLHERGIRLGVNIDPGEGIYPHEQTFNKFAASLNITDEQTIPFNAFDKGFMRNYLEQLIKPLDEQGVDFYWLDFYPQNRVQLNALNYYQEYNYANNQNNRGLIMSRVASLVPHRYGILYGGETFVGWNTLKKIPEMMAKGSNIGLSWWSYDIGGYKKGTEDKELYIRYVELGCFSPIFRFSSEEGHYYKRKPWKWDINTYQTVKTYCELRKRLVPYLYGEAYKYHKAGIPIIQPLYYADPLLYDEVEFRNEYLFGSELLVAPITKANDNFMQRAVQHIYLPSGIWYDFKTGKKFIGDKRYYMFYKDEDYPVFAKQGAIVCLGDLEENINVTNVPKTMEVHIFPGKSNIYNLYEDDGISQLYKDGYYIVTRFDYNYLENNYTLIIRPFEGKSGIIPNQRNYRIRFRNTREARDVDVMLENTPLPFESYVDDNDFVIEINNVNTTKQVTIICRGRDIEIDAKRIINDDIDSIINDLQITTALKMRISDIMFSDIDIARKRVYLRKLKDNGLDNGFIKMFLKLLDYIQEI